MDALFPTSRSGVQMIASSRPSARRPYGRVGLSNDDSRRSGATHLSDSSVEFVNPVWPAGLQSIRDVLPPQCGPRGSRPVARDDSEPGIR